MQRHRRPPPGRPIAAGGLPRRAQGRALLAGVSCTSMNRRSRRRQAALAPTLWPRGCRISSGPRCPIRSCSTWRRRTASSMQPEVCPTQVERMLKDAPLGAFIDGFLDSWLTLRDLGSMPPDREKFDDYYRYRPADGDARGDAALHPAPARRQPEHRAISSTPISRSSTSRWPGITASRRRSGSGFEQVQPDRSPPRRPARPGERAHRHGQRHRHLARRPRRLAAGKHSRHAPFAAAARCGAARS